MRPLRRAVFVHVPKTAGSAIIQWANRNSQKHSFVLDHCGHATLEEINGTGDKVPLSQYTDIDPYVIFGVRRNTYDRMISVYNHIGLQPVTRREKTKEWKLYSKAHKKGIVYFTDWINDNKSSRYTHWNRSLIEWLKGVNVVLQYENLHNQFKIIKEVLAVPDPLKPANVLPYRYRKSTYYTQDYIDVIQKHYGEEIEKYKYLPKKCLTS